MSEVRQTCTERNRSIPTLRFSEFVDEWNTSSLNKVVKINPKSAMLPDSFVYIDLESVTNGNLSKQHRIAKENSPSRAQRLLKKGDILYQTVRPYQKNNFFFDKEENDYVASTGYAQLRTENISSFVFQYIHTDLFVNKVLLRCTGTSYPSVNSSDLSKIKVKIPSLLEQQKIASFLSSVDKKLNLLQQKKILLEAYKKGVMQQIFSQELRFQPEEGGGYPEWEEKRLGEVTNYVKGFAFKSKDYQDSGVRIVRVSDLLSDSIKLNNERIFIDEDKSKSYEKYRLKKGNIIITTVGSKPDMIESAVGRGIYIKNDNEGLLNQNMLKFKNISGINNGFLIGLINSDRYRSFMKGIARGNANQANITVIELLKYKVKIPCIAEQTQIANFLSALNDKIALVNTQIESTQKFKKGLLQQMFV